MMTTPNVRKPRRPPCAPVKGVREFFEKVASKAPPPRITKDYLASIGVAASNEQHLVSTLKFLDLIDKRGVPTRHFEVLYMKGAERTRGLQNLLRQAYPSLFTGQLDLRTATRADLHDHFVRHYGLRGQMPRKAIAVFTLLCTFAGIPLSADLARQGRPELAPRPPRPARPRALATPPTPIEVGRPASQTVAGSAPFMALRGGPILLTVTPEMSEDELVAFLRRVQRAMRRVAEEEE